MAEKLGNKGHRAYLLIIVYQHQKVIKAKENLLTRKKIKILSNKLLKVKGWLRNKVMVKYIDTMAFSQLMDINFVMK